MERTLVTSLGKPVPSYKKMSGKIQVQKINAVTGVVIPAYEPIIIGAELSIFGTSGRITVGAKRRQ